LAANAAGFGALIASIRERLGAAGALQSSGFVPDRAWERVYRDLFQHDSTFHFLCAPNDTHNCLIKSFVRSGVVTRLGPSMRYGEATDLQGNGTTHRWDPRICQKGLALTRRFYGDRRVRHPMVRKGFKRGTTRVSRAPRTGCPPKEYFDRARDAWVRVTHDEAAAIAAAGAEEHRRDVHRRGGQEEAARPALRRRVRRGDAGRGHAGAEVPRRHAAARHHARVRHVPRGELDGAARRARIRKVGPDKALGARGFDNYSWHTDLPPGHPMVTGQQTVEFDLHSVEHAKTVVVWGMNWITTKMPDAHWLTEARVKGTKVVVIACEYSATATKADDVLVVRPGMTPALALGFAHVILREKLYDDDYVKRWTDLPLLVRMDNLKLLRASEVFGGEATPLSNQTHVLKPRARNPPPPIAQRDAVVTRKLRRSGATSSGGTSAPRPWR
jgi:nitrate reductase alpha subunit